MISPDFYLLVPFLVFESLRPQLNLLVVVGDEVAARILLLHIADDRHILNFFHLLVIALFYGEEKFIVLAAVEGDGCGDDFQALQGVEGELVDGGFVLEDGASEAGEMADVE